MSELVAYQGASLTERKDYAHTLAQAGDLIKRGLWSQGQGKPPAPSPGKILLVMETGSMLGLHPAAALQSIDVVEGNATLSARLMSALIRKAGHKLEVVKSGSIPTGDYTVTVTGTRSDDATVTTSVWDLHRAVRAGLVDSYRPDAKGVWQVRARSKGDHPKPWEAHAEVMPVWRAISEVGREGFSDVLFGLYSTEEMQDAPFGVDEAAPSEDWEALANEETTSDGVRELWRRAQDAGQLTDDLRATLMSRAGALDRTATASGDDAEAAAEDIEYAEVVEDEPDATVASPAETPATETAIEDPGVDWTALADGCESRAGVKLVWSQAKDASALALPIEPGSDITVKQYLIERAASLPEVEATA